MQESARKTEKTSKIENNTCVVYYIIIIKCLTQKNENIYPPQQKHILEAEINISIYRVYTPENPYIPRIKKQQKTSQKTEKNLIK